MPKKKDSEREKETGKTLRETFVEKELLQASVVQRELVKGLGELNASLKTLDQTLNLIKEHEFVELHSSKWKIFAYQIFLGVLFAIGTVLGLMLLSWMTYTFFKDSEALRAVVDNQLRLRQLDFKEMKEKVRMDAEHGEASKATASGSENSSGGSLPR